MTKQALPDDPKTYFLDRGVSISEVARQYHGRPRCDRMTLSRRARREDWWGQRIKIAAKVAQKTVDLIADTVAERDARHLRSVRNVATLADAVLQGLAQDITASGGVTVLAQDQKKLRTVALVIRACALAAAGSIHVERALLGDTHDSLQDIFGAAERAMNEAEAVNGKPSGNGGDGGNGKRPSHAIRLRGGARGAEEVPR